MLHFHSFHHGQRLTCRNLIADSDRERKQFTRHRRCEITAGGSSFGSMRQGINQRQTAFACIGNT